MRRTPESLTGDVEIKVVGKSGQISLGKRYAGKTLRLERRSESDWRVIEPKAGATKEGKVNDLLLTLRALRWKTLVSPKGDDAARYGLATPELEVTLSRADGGEIGALLVGKQEGDVTYVRVRSGPAIYAVESRQLGDLRRAPTEIPG